MAFHNAFAVLVHDQPDCISDLVRNLLFLDPGSTILLFNGSGDPGLFAGLDLPERVLVVPQASRQRWGDLMPFLLTTGRFALELGVFDALTIVDSDQLLLRPGYSDMLAETFAANPNVGMLVTGLKKTAYENLPFHMPSRDAMREADRWRPVFGSLRALDAHWGKWTFWPGTVFSSDGLRALIERWDTDATLRDIVAQTEMGVTEEIIPPSLISAMGFALVSNPANRVYLRYKTPLSLAEVEDAIATDDGWWLHPVLRRFNDPVRMMVRRRWLDYVGPLGLAQRLVSASPVGALGPAGLLARGNLSAGRIGEEIVVAAAQRLMASAPGDVLEIGSASAWRAATLVRVGSMARPRANVARVTPNGTVRPSMPPTANHWQDDRRPLDHMLEGLGLEGLGWEIGVVDQALASLGPLTLVALDGAAGQRAWTDMQQAIEARMLSGGWVAATDGDAPGAAEAIARAALATGRFEPVAWAGHAVVLEQTASPL